MPPIRAVLFDIDGTLLDTRDFIVEAFRHAAAQFQFRSASWQDVLDMHGASLEDCYRLLAPDRGPEIESFCVAHRDFQLANFSLATPYPETLATLGHLQNRGLLIAGVTARKSDTCGVLAHCGIAGFLQFCIAADQVRECKPHPEGVQLALTRLGVRADEAVMVGDTTADILAARAAGLAAAIAVRTGFFHEQEMARVAPDYILDGVEDIPGLLDSFRS